MADKTYEIEVKTTADTEGITSVKDALEETKSSVEEVNDAMDSVNSNANETGDELQSAFEEATAEVERLEEALDEAHMNGDDVEADIIADELADATAKAEELQSQLEAVNSTGVDGAKESVDGLDESLQKATESAEETSNTMGLIDSAVMMDMANQVGSLGASAESMAQEMNTASISVGQLATNTGIAEPQLVSMINNISNATFPQNEAIAYANALNQMGVSADKLGDSATNMDVINDATGIGYQKVMQLTQGLQAVGVSADQLPSSFNAIAYAQANVNGGADTLTTVLKRQASTINEYGLNTDQLVVIMQKLSQQGVQGMKMGSELSKVLKENNGDISAIEQSLGLQAGTLSNATSLTGQYEGQLKSLADEEAQHKTLIDQLNAGWEDMQLMLSPILSPLTSFIGLIGQVGQTAMAINSIKTLADTVGLVGKVSPILSSVGGAFSSLWGIIIANPIILIVVAIIALIGALIWAYYNVDWFREMVDNAWASIQGFAGWISGAFMGAIQGLGDAFNNAGQTLQDAFTGAVTFVQETLQGLYDYIMTLGGLLPEGVNVTGNQIVDSIIAVMLFIATLPIQLQIIFINMIASALGFGNNFVQTMFTTALNSVNGFLQWISQLPSRVGAFLSSVVGRASSFAGSFISSIVNAGSNAVNGFLNSIGQMAGGLANELNNMLSLVGEWASTLPQKFWDAGVQAVQNFLNALGIHSPGTMQRMMLWEVSEMGERIPRESKTLLSNVGKLGEGIVDEFGNPSLDVETNLDSSTFGNNNSSTGFNQVNNFYFEDIVVDDDDRMQKIADYIQKQLDWNNKTAGRTI